MTRVSLDFRPMAVLRRRCGASQATIAAELEVCTSTVSKWETNARGVSAENLFALARVMGAPVWQLCTVTEEKEPSRTPVRAPGATRTPGKHPSGPSIHDSAGTPGTSPRT
jgi:transcriptional regulator with XRE-family HTH domain